MPQLRAFLLIVGVVWAMGFIGFLLTNVLSSAGANIFEIPLSTWEMAVTAGIVGVFTYLGTVVFPVVIKPSSVLKLPKV